MNRTTKLGSGLRVGTNMKKRFTTLGQGLLIAAAFTGASCTDETPAGSPTNPDDELQLGVNLEELGIEVPTCTQAVAATASSPNFVAATKILTLTLADNVDAVITVVNGKLKVNGWQCAVLASATAPIAPAAELTSTNVNLIKILANGTTSNKVIVDLLPGAFGNIFSATGGIIVTDVAATGNVSLGVRGNASANAVKMAQEGTTATGPFYLEVSGDTRADIKFIGNPSLVSLALGDGGDSFTAQGQVLTTTALAGTGATTSVSSTEGLNVFGGAGADTLKGGLGDDTLSGGDGNDIFQTSAGAIDDGADTYIGGSNVDLLDYSGRTDAVTASVAPSFTNGWIQGVNLTAASVTGVLTCADGALGTTADTVTFSGTVVGTEDILTAINAGLTGADASVNDRGELVIVSLTTGQNMSCASSGAGTALFGASGASNNGVSQLAVDANDGITGELDDVRADVENITGGTGNDILTGSSSSNTINGGAGNDDIAGGPAGDTCTTDVDVLNGGDGDDIFRMGSLKNCGDAVDGGLGRDMASYELRTVALTLDIDASADDGETAEADTLKVGLEVVVGGSAVDSIVGGAGDDELHGGEGADFISGGAGADTIVGGPGADTLLGGAGEDIFNETDTVDLAFTGAVLPTDLTDSDLINGGADTDTANYGRTSTTVLTITLCSAPTNVTSGGACAGGAADGPDADDLTNIEHFIGGAGADIITGTAGDDFIEGGAGADSILGGAGTDQLFGDIGVDSLEGGDGDDTLDGGAGANRNDGGNGEDVCSQAAASLSFNCEL